MENKKINTIRLRQWLRDTKNISLEKKRYLLENFNNLNTTQLEELYLFSKKPEKKTETANFFQTYAGGKIKTLFKSISILFIIIFIWNFYATPYGISIRSFPGSIWHTRKALNLLKKEAPHYHNLVINNIDILSFKYIEVSSGHDAYAEMTNNEKIKVSLLTQHVLEPSYLAGELVHEACHGKQFHDKRINMLRTLEDEPRQKIEHECLLLQIDTMEILKANQKTITYFKKTSSGNGVYGDNWQKKWMGGDTSMGLMELLPEEKRIQWNVPGFVENKNIIKKTKIKKQTINKFIKKDS